ncbi:MAG: YihY/virulence factor BrkB family protein [Thermosynechococcaceae cyanobacterium]
MPKLKRAMELLKLTVAKWQADKASRLAAALAYYTAFSLAPILVIFIAILSLVYGEKAAQAQLLSQFQDLVGEEGADVIRVMMQDTQQPGSGITATLSSIVFLIFGATGMFVQLQDSLNTIWKVKPKPGRGLMSFIRDRILSFAMVLGIGFLLLVALIFSAGLAAFSTFLRNGSDGFIQLGQILNFVISFGVITVLFALIYKVLPDVLIKWSDVWVGAVITSTLFAIGKSLIGLYLGHSSFSSTYGAAGSLAVLLLWVYYSAQILFFGAELTQVYAQKYGSKIRPAKYAISMDPDA